MNPADDTGLRALRDTMGALFGPDFRRGGPALSSHPMARWAWRLAQARYLTACIDRVTTTHRLESR